jgi:lysozyme
MKRISEAGLELIKLFEGVRFTAYDDGVGVWTIGVGHTKGVQRGDTATKEEVDNWLREDVSDAEDAVNRLVESVINQAQFDALVSFTFNVGAGALERSTLLKRLNGKDFDAAADEFLRWNKAGGSVMAGLTKRRIAERKMFLTGTA